MDNPTHRLIHRVWKAPRGNEQFASVIGQGRRNSDGEFANPGLVLLSLIGHASEDRVPVVFYWVGDLSAEIPRAFPVQASPY